MLAKALSFAAGLLYREQNMKDVKKRKHKLMPTPRHDRLQVGRCPARVLQFFAGNLLGSPWNNVIEPVVFVLDE